MTERSPKKIYLSILVTLLLLIFFHYIGWLKWIEGATRQTMAVLLTKTHLLSVTTKQQADIPKDKLVCQNEYEQTIFWQKQNDISNVHLKILEQENSELKKILNFSQQSGYKVITATVIGAGSENTERVLAISSGLKNGIKVGQSVVVLDGIMVGKIIKAEEDISWILLINDSDSKIAAMILNEEKSQGIVEGGYGLSVNMNYVPRNEKVTVGETVVTSGLDQSVPKGLLLGTVAAVVNEAYQPFQKAVINPASDLSKLTTVGVLVEEK